VTPDLLLQENINAVKNKPVMIHVASLKIFMIIILILLSVKVEINSYGQPSGIKKFYTFLLKRKYLVFLKGIMIFI